MTDDRTRAGAAGAISDARTIRLSEYIREQAEKPAHQRWVADVMRQVARGKFDREPLDVDGLKALLRRNRPS